MKKAHLRQSALSLLALAGALALSLSPASAEILTYTAALDSAQVVPSPTVSVPPKTLSPGKGTAELVYDTTKKTITWTISYSGLSGPARSVKLHSPASAGHVANATVVNYGDIETLPIKSDYATQVGAPVSDAFDKALRDGNVYVQIGTTAYPLGEVRGQLSLKK